MVESPPMLRTFSGRATIALSVLLLVVSSARAGLGVFVDGKELDGTFLEGDGWEFEDGVLTIGRCHPNGTPEIVLSGNNRSGEVSVLVEGAARILLRDLSLRTQESNSTPFRIVGGNEVVLLLSGENRLEAGPLCAGLQLEYGVDSVVVTNAPGEPSGRLVATGGPEGAGIGGASLDNHVMRLVVSGGRIEAYGGENAAGIGGGLDGTLHELLLEGGTVVARGGENGDDVGGGPYGSVLQVTVTGGSLDAKTVNDSPRRQYETLRRVSLRTLDWRQGDPVSADFSDCGFTYGTNSVFADGTGAVHFWLPHGKYDIFANGTLFPVQSEWFDVTIDLSRASFRVWCRSNGFEPYPTADAGGEAALVRYAFGKPFGIPPLPEIDASGAVPVLRVPDVRRTDAIVRCFGSPDLSAPESEWMEFFPDKHDRNLWTAEKTLTPNPPSFFAKYVVSTELPPLVALQIGTNVFSVELAKTRAAQQFRERFPLTLEMEKYYVLERYVDLEDGLPSSPQAGGLVEVGEFYLLGTQRLVFSTRTSMKAGYQTPIGKVECADGFVDAVGEGSVVVTFREKTEGDP